VASVKPSNDLQPNRPRRDADHSTPSSAEVKNAWIYTSVPSYAYKNTVASFTSPE